jgi:peptidyl-prolyl cis-trans isomerase D
VIVVAFGFSFGLPDDSLSFGKQGLARAYGESISREEYSYQTRMSAFVLRVAPREESDQKRIRWRENVLDAVVERRVFANLAEKMGLAASVRDAEELTTKGQWMAFGISSNTTDEAFSYKWFTRSLLPQVQASERAYLEFQRQELLARDLRDLVNAHAFVSDAEQRIAYEAATDFATVAYVLFDPKKFSEIADPSPSEIDAYVAAHASELETAYEAAANRFKAMPSSVDLWFLSRRKNPSDPDPSSENGAKAQSEAARARIKAGESFAKVARELSEDSATALSGGHYGWVDLAAAKGALEAMALDEAVVTAAATLGNEGVSEVIEGKDAFFVVAVTGERSGDVEKSQAIRELAQEAVRREKGARLASEAADRINADVIAQQKPLEEILRAANLVPAEMQLGPGCDLGIDVKTSPQVRRDGEIYGVGKFPAEVSALFALPAGKVAVPESKPIAQNEKSMVLTLVERKKPTDEEFLEARKQRVERWHEAKAQHYIKVLGHSECLAARGRGDIKPNEPLIKRLMTYDNAKDQGDGSMSSYNMCNDVGAAAGDILAELRMQQLREQLQRQFNIQAP